MKDRFFVSLIVGLVLWVLFIFMFGAHVSGNLVFWEELTASWGYATFRVWGDAVTIISLPVLVIASVVGWGFYELGRCAYFRLKDAQDPIGRHRRRRQYRRKYLV